MRKVSPPETIKIGPHTFRVVVVPDEMLLDQGSYGHTALRKLVIAIDGATPFTQEADTVLHECIHAMLSSTTLEEAIEEQVASALAPALLSCLRDNPDLVKYILQNNPDERDV